MIRIIQYRGIVSEMGLFNAMSYDIMAMLFNFLTSESACLGLREVWVYIY